MTGKGFELRGVSKNYGSVTVLAGISLALTAGRHTALLGPSGCGKSTVLRLLAGLETPDAGEIFINGSVASAPAGTTVEPQDRNIGMVFQDLALWPNLSALDNVRLGQAVDDRDAHDALERCGIETLAKRRPGELSGGQQQRVALARAIAAQPSFLFLDEPFAGLDWASKSVLLDEISALASIQSLTIFLVSHDPAEVLALSDQLIVLENTRIAETGAVAAVLAQPRTRTTEYLRDYSKLAML